MSGESLYACAFEPKGSPDALPDRLTIPQLAELRATSDDGFDHDLFKRLKSRMEVQAGTGRLRTVEVDEWDWTGEWRVRRAKDRGSRGYAPDEPIEQEWVFIRPLSGGGVPPDAVKVMVSRKAVYVARDAARALHGVDPEAWGEGSLTWARIALAAVPQFASGSAIPADSSEVLTTAQAIEYVASLGYALVAVQAKFDHVSDNAWLMEAKVPGRRGGYYKDRLAIAFRKSGLAKQPGAARRDGLRVLTAS